MTYAMKKYVQPLIDSGIIKLTVPDAPSSPNQKYYSYFVHFPWAASGIT